MALATTKMSSKGQVVIPEAIRQQMNLRDGARFIVVHHGDTVLLKTIPQPSKQEFAEALRKIRAEVKASGLKKSDLTRAIKQARSGKQR